MSKDKKKLSFKEAFARARKLGMENFTWNGKKYSTVTKDDEKRKADDPVQKKIKKYDKYWDDAQTTKEGVLPAGHPDNPYPDKPWKYGSRIQKTGKEGKEYTRYAYGKGGDGVVRDTVQYAIRTPRKGDVSYMKDKKDWSTKATRHRETKGGKSTEGAYIQSDVDSFSKEYKRKGQPWDSAIKGFKGMPTTQEIIKAVHEKKKKGSKKRK